MTKYYELTEEHKHNKEFMTKWVKYKLSIENDVPIFLLPKELVEEKLEKYLK